MDEPNKNGNKVQFFQFAVIAGSDNDGRSCRSAVSGAMAYYEREGKNASAPVADWDLRLSRKQYVFQPGRAFGGVVVEVVEGSDPKKLTVAQAKKACLKHPTCLAFTYATHSTSLSGFAEIEFLDSVERVVRSGIDDWRTFVVNDPKKARSSVVNVNEFEWNEDWEKEPYVNCCDRTVFEEDDGDKGERRPVVPSITDLEAVDTLPRVNCNIPKEEFQRRYEETRTPVILTGCSDGWPARERWTFDALANRFDNGTTWRARTSLLDDDYEDTRWGDIRQAMHDGRPFYIFDKLDHEAGREIEKDYQTPGPFEGMDFYEKGFPKKYGSRRWFVVGPAMSGSKPHKDPFFTDAWNTLIRGHKWWVLYPRVVKSEKLVKCSAACPGQFEGDGHGTLANWYLSVGVNAARTIYAEDGQDHHPMTVLQKPGETI